MLSHGESSGTSTCMLFCMLTVTPHESTVEKPSYLLFGKDLRTPTETAYLPGTKNALVSDLTTYHEKLVVGLSLAREQAAEAMQRAQRKYNKYYDKGTRPNPLQRTGDIRLVRVRVRVDWRFRVICLNTLRAITCSISFCIS